MEKLLAITEKLVTLSSISNDSTTGLREYKLKRGNAFTSTIYQSDDIAVAVGHFSWDAIFPPHCHPNSTEILVVYKGNMSVITDRRNVTLSTGQSIELEPGEIHMLKFHESTKLLVATIPPDFEAVAKIISNGRGE